ncbi:MAG: TonB-dependent receptor plug domain-containing protein [Candidatus Cryptobacteroides sp.]
MKTRAIVIFAASLAASFTLSAQNLSQIDSADIYKDRTDSLEATVFVGRQSGNYLSKGKPIRTEIISAAGLCKMACCNLAESFENSASVTVGYSDAVTGARQIRLLGLSGTYTQMLDENRPVMRGLAAPFGLSYVPGQWLESIQIAKGSSSVINGVESITGQINLEHRKPTDEKPLFLNASVMNDTKTDFNIASSLQMGEHWSTAILGHVSGNFKAFDHNHDGYLDDPKMLQFNLSNRWLYYADNGVQVRFGVRALQDTRKGGQEGYDHNSYSLTGDYTPWGSDITNRSINGYLKVGIPLVEDNSQNIALVADYNYMKMDSWFGATTYLAGQHSGFLNLLYQNEINESHKFTLGLSSTYDRFNEHFLRRTIASLNANPQDIRTDIVNAGVFGEYTFHAGDKFSSILGLRADWYNTAGLRFTPRLTLKYTPIDEIVIRANGGRGLRTATPLIDNIGVFSTGKEYVGNFGNHLLEDAWTFGGNITYYIPFNSNTYVSFDYFRTQFAQQMVVDYEQAATEIHFYNLDGRRSYTNSYQLDFNIEPVERFTVTLTARYTDAKMELKNKGLVEKPMTSRFKGVLNLQYATNLNKWIFDFTASLNGSARVYDFMKDLRDENGNLIYQNGRTPVYPLLYLQVTKRFKGVDLYLGGENLTNFRQKDVILGSVKDDHGHVDARQASFDASAIWGPLMGVKVYLGVRFTLWKK